MSEPEPRVPEAYRARALEQALAILDVLAEGPERTLPEIAERLGMKTPNTHKLVLHLQEAGLVETSPVSKRYRLGARRLTELSQRAIASLSPWEALRPVVPRLAEATGMPGLIAVLAGARVVYVEQFRGPERALGRAFPAHATALGKALLGALPPGAAEALLTELVLDAWTPKTIVDPTTLEADLTETRKRGYALEDGELDLARRSVGAPVRDHTGTAIAAIGIGGSAADLPDAELARVAGLVVDEARRASEALGASLARLPARRLDVEVLGVVEPPVPPEPGDPDGADTATRAARTRSPSGERRR